MALSLPALATPLEDLKIAVDTDDPAAQFRLGSAYDAGELVRRDYIEAADWWKKAAEQGNAEAQLCLGLA